MKDRNPDLHPLIWIVDDALTMGSCIFIFFSIFRTKQEVISPAPLLTLLVEVSFGSKSQLESSQLAFLPRTLNGILRFKTQCEKVRFRDL